MKDGRNEASTVALPEAGPNSGVKAALRALDGMKAVRGRIAAARLGAKADVIEWPAERVADLTVANRANGASLASLCSHFPKSI